MCLFHFGAPLHPFDFGLAGATEARVYAARGPLWSSCDPAVGPVPLANGVGIDSPAFNLRLAHKLRSHGIKTIHYVSPSVWAYHRSRIRKIKKSIDLMLTLFPFETSIYKDYGVPVSCVGHPLADKIGFEDNKLTHRKRPKRASDTRRTCVGRVSEMHLTRVGKPYFLNR